MRGRGAHRVTLTCQGVSCRGLAHPGSATGKPQPTIAKGGKGGKGEFRLDDQGGGAQVTRPSHTS